jgi:hypothetical protein
MTKKMPQISSHARGLLKNVFSHRLSFLIFVGWFVRGLRFGTPPDTPHKFRGKPLKTPEKPPPYATRALTGGCSF